MDASSRDLLDADELLAEPLKPAQWSKRLANVFIDFFFFYVLIITLGVIIALINPNWIDAIANSDSALDRIVSTLLYISYYVAFEGWLGKTPGKIITKTKVVDKDGQKPTWISIVWRSLGRIIPFDAFTFLKPNPIGMHDRLANTMVVDNRPRKSLDRSLAHLPEA